MTNWRASSPNDSPTTKQKNYETYGRMLHSISLVCRQWLAVTGRYCETLLKTLCECNKRQSICYPRCHAVPYETYDAFCCMWNMCHRAFLLKYLRRWTCGTSFCHKIFNESGSCGSTFYLCFPLREKHKAFFKNLFRHEHFNIDKFCFQNVHLIVDNGIHPFDSHCLLECAFNSIQNKEKHKEYFKGTHMSVYL